MTKVISDFKGPLTGPFLFQYKNCYEREKLLSQTASLERR